jgi:hypothetical protein
MAHQNGINGHFQRHSNNDVDAVEIGVELKRQKKSDSRTYNERIDSQPAQAKFHEHRQYEKKPRKCPQTPMERHHDIVHPALRPHGDSTIVQKNNPPTIYYLFTTLAA